MNNNELFNKKPNSKYLIIYAGELAALSELYNEIISKVVQVNIRTQLNDGKVCPLTSVCMG